jgi:hypothetical protein
MSLFKAAIVCVGVATAIALGCSDYTEEASNGACSNLSYSAGAPHVVACPGVGGCACTAPSVCCMGSIDGHAGNCVDPRDCNAFVLSCDGPEDCGGGVCCMTSNGTSCTTASACTGQWLCRNDSHCVGSPTGSNCAVADFGTKGVNNGLDGIIGLCKR